jgi:hypothetical protein
LSYSEIRCCFHYLFHAASVGGFICLRTSGAYGWTFSCVQNTELDTSLVDCLRHFATECIDFSHQVTFANTANSGITGHLPNVIRDSS